MAIVIPTLLCLWFVFVVVVAIAAGRAAGRRDAKIILAAVPPVSRERNTFWKNHA